MCVRNVGVLGFHCNLQVHVRMHSGEKLYVCKECEKIFSQPSSFKYHVRTHHEEKHYKCKEYGKSSGFPQPARAFENTHWAETL